MYNIMLENDYYEKTSIFYPIIEIISRTSFHLSFVSEELLEHEDMVVGITASQILTEIHANCGSILEKVVLCMSMY